MLVSIALVAIVWLIGELILYVLHWYRHREATIVPRLQEDRILISCLGLAFGMFVALLVYIKLTYFLT